MVIHFLDKESSKRNNSFRCSEWGPEDTRALVREARVFKVPDVKEGEVRTLGEYVDRTPKHMMSKVMLEETVFDTWYGGRTVLLGDGKSVSLIGALGIRDLIKKLTAFRVDSSFILSLPQCIPPLFGL